MKRFTVQIEGMCPMLHNRLSREINKEKKKVEKGLLDEWEDNNWAKKLYTKNIDGEDIIIVPEDNVHAMMITACMKYKVPPPDKSIGRTWTAYFKSAVIVDNSAVVNYSRYEAFGRMVNGNPSRGGGSSKVWSVRPIIHDWSLTLTFLDAENRLDIDTVTEILTHAGKFVGLSDWRPRFGRFKIIDVNVEALE